MLTVVFMRIHDDKPDEAAAVTEYCTSHSDDVSEAMKELADWTCSEFSTAWKMSSPLQAATLRFIAEWAKPKRVLEIGCYSGYSALAWYEGTAKTRAEIVTTELDPAMIRAARQTIERYGLGDRVALIEGPAQETIQRLTGEFDLVFVDANKEGYEGYVRQILDQRLLSQRGLILCDNVLARGLTVLPQSRLDMGGEQREYWLECGKALDGFSKFCKDDPRVDNLLLPVYDGLSLIKWKES